MRDELFCRTWTNFTVPTVFFPTVFFLPELLYPFIFIQKIDCAFRILHRDTTRNLIFASYTFFLFRRRPLLPFSVDCYCSFGVVEKENRGYLCFRKYLGKSPFVSEFTSKSERLKKEYPRVMMGLPVRGRGSHLIPFRTQKLNRVPFPAVV